MNFSSARTGPKRLEAGFRRCCKIAALVAVLLTAPATAAAQSYNISTFAGGALPVNIPATSASLYGPQSSVAIDKTGNVFFVDGNTVLRLDANSGVLTLVAGNGTAGYSGDNGPAVSAQLHGPYGLALDSAGNLYIAGFYDNVVRKVTGGVITTVVGTGTAGFSGDNGPATAAQLNAPFGITVDSADNLYIADYGNNRIREVSAGTITTVAGNGVAGYGGDNGPAVDAQLNFPHAVAVDASGNLYISDTGNNRIRKVSSGVIGTAAGNGTPGFSGDNGPAIAAQLNVPCGMVLDSVGNLFIADYYNNRVRRLFAGVITTAAGKGTPGFSGDGGPASSAQLNNPFVVSVDSAGNLYIADYGNNRIRKVSAGVINTVAGNGTSGFSGDGGSATSAQLHLPYGIAVDATGELYDADYGNHRIRKISGGVIISVAGTGVPGFSGDTGPAISAQLNQPSGIALDSGGELYIADFGNNRVRKISGGLITTVAGNGTAGFSGDSGLATNAELNQPAGVALDATGNLFIADSGNNRVRKVSAGTITTVAGTGIAGFSGDSGPASSAQLYQPMAVATDSAGDLYIADTGNNRIRKVSGGSIATVAGNGTAGFSGDNAAATGAQLNAPDAVSVSSSGELYIADTSNNRIRVVSGGTIATLAGGGPSFGDGGAAASAQLAGPQGIGIDGAGNVYVADTQDNRIRQLAPVPLSITGPSSLPPGTVGVAYAGVTFTATGGAGGYTWSATGLPAGLSLSAAGALTGIPTSAAVSNPEFTVKDSGGNTANASLSLTVAVPVPTITTVSPTSATVYGAAFTLTVNGTGFANGAAIQWNGSALTTKFVSATQLTASVLASLIGSPGSATIVVSSGGVSSSAFTFPINAPTPAVTALNPASATATTAGFTLTVTGTGFVSTSQIEWNGTALTTTFVSATQLTAPVSASLIASAGTASVLVSTGQASSSALTFTINAPPAISTLSPSSATAGGAAFTLTVNGTGFATGAAIQWNGSALTTKFVSATQLTASVPASLIATTGSATILATSGGASSGSLTFAINNPTPAITALNPASATATTAGFTLTVTGTGFVSSSQIEWSATALTTTFVSATQLTAPVSAGLIASAGTASVQVSTGQASSGALTFTINAPPAITTLSPSSATAGGAAFTLTLTGTGFATGAAIQWNGSPLTTKFVSATQLTASVPASLIASTGSTTIVVMSGGASSGSLTFAINNPTPAITALNPASATATTAGFTLTVTGTGFVSSSQIEWNGTALTTTFVSATQLTAPVSASLIASAGTASVLVSTGQVSSGALTFTINAPPAITTLSPSSATAGGVAFTLTVTGTGFATGAAIQWNGSPLTTKFVSATQLTASVAASLIATAGSATILATSGGASSGSLTFAINNPTPAITALNPASANATAAAFTLTVTGTGFVSSSQIQWNGTALTTTFVSATQLTASVSDSLIASAGTASVVVTTGQASSSALTFTINAPPAITTLSPSSATAGGASFTLTVTGTGFATGAAIQWNGSALTTKFVSATQLTASVASSLIATAGSATILATSGGVSSNTLTLSINNPTPAITALSPASAIATGPAFTLTVTGTGFVSSSQVQWNGAALATTFVSATQLTASVSDSLIANAGSASVLVGTGQASSGTLTFTIGAPPAVTSLSPSSATAYGPAFTLTVNGSGFASGATVLWNNTSLTTKFVSATQLTASVPVTVITGAGSVNIVVTSGTISSSAFPFPITPPPPAITSLSPASAVATGAAFTLIVNGTGFTQSAVVQWNGTALPTTFAGANQLTAFVSASLIATAGNVSIVVTSGGTNSAASTFTVGAPPAIASLSPASAAAGGAAFTLTVTGTGFVSGSQVQWNGAALPTTFVSATQLTAAVPASLVANIGGVTIQVSFSGASSNGLALPINGPPVITSLSPAAAAAGGTAFTLTANGTGFVSGATVNWNGTALTTTYVSATQLTAAVSATLIGTAGTASITVSSGGLSSVASPLSINAPPAITSLGPASVAATGAAFTLTVNGTGFLSGASVQWNGTALTTTYVSTTQLVAAVPANLAAGTGTASITAVNPGGASSVAAKLALTAAVPAITQGGVVPIYSTATVIQPGSWISIYGSGLAGGTYLWKGDFPTTLGGTTVTIDNKPAYLWSVSPTQINLQAPDDTATGPVNVVVKTSAGSTSSTVTLAQYGPSFSLLPASEYAAAVILTPSGSGAYGGGTYDLAGPTGFFTFNTRPVKTGETLELFGVGFGPTSPVVPAGKAFSGAAPTTGPVTVTIGGVSAEVLFSGITEAGLYQFNVIVPKVGSGDQPLLASVGSVKSPTGVLITVQ